MSTIGDSDCGLALQQDRSQLLQQQVPSSLLLASQAHPGAWVAAEAAEAPSLCSSGSTGSSAGSAGCVSGHQAFRSSAIGLAGPAWPGKAHRAGGQGSSRGR